MKDYHFTAAGVGFTVRTPLPLQVTEESLPFFRENAPGREEVEITVCPVGKLPPPPAEGVWFSDRCYARLDGYRAIFRREGPGCPPYALTVLEEGGRVRCLCLPGGEEGFRDTRRLLGNIGFERLLLERGGLILHAAFVRLDGQGVLFSAPSGTGKSTQAGLWTERFGAEVLNGDRAGLRKAGGEWNAWGLPLAGSSGVYRNGNAPLRAIVVLGQASENTIRPLRGREALARLLPEVSIHRWDREFTARAMDLLLELLARVPVYALDCRPDAGAAELARRTVFRERL